MRGQVQGVGFRPFVWQLAARLGVKGTVSNDAEGVLIFATGGDLDTFEAALMSEAPALAVVDAVESAAAEVADTDVFRIAESGAPGAETRVTPDAATCDDCAAEIRDPQERRHGYAFTNCTNCGPRFTILKALPYDRAQTTMAPFEMCASCRKEYENPVDRRFHAQPVACPHCGPRLWAEAADGTEIKAPAIETAAAWLAQGKIIAIKGLGGFHLACDAWNDRAVATLRTRKRRPGKPLALMAPFATIQRLAAPSHEECRQLASPASPIVLLRRRDDGLPDTIAPGQDRLGWMLPYTPLHHLLLDAVGGPLLMTSGNLSGEPQVIANAEAREKLASFVDGYLMHDREIARRLDDGVELLGPQGPVVLRRARGRVPSTIALPQNLSDREVVAYGGELKSAICLTKNGQALLSHHIGDFDNALTVEEFLKADVDLAQLFNHRPEAIAVDLHPDFRATRHGRIRAEKQGLPMIAVQHHHAHMAAQLGESGWTGDTAIGLILDGLGLGPDGTVWGGEVLAGGYAHADRVAFLKPAPLVGGDRAQAEPWRNAVMRLDQAGLSDLADRLFPDQPLALLRQAAATRLNAPLSSSVGRLFDAVAACLGLSPIRQSYEGEAAMLLQALAGRASQAGSYTHATDGLAIDPEPMFAELATDLAHGEPAEVIAARFHGFLANAFASSARAAAEARGTDTIALSGGCFQNVLLLEMMISRLDGFRICGPGAVPANDGGLAFGQALVALAQVEST